MKKVSALVLVLVAVLLVGCFTPKINVKILPNPIELTMQQLLDDNFVIKSGTIKLELWGSGISTSYHIPDVDIVVTDDAGEVLYTKTVDVDITTPVGPVKVPEDKTPKVPDISLKDLFDFDPDVDLDIIEYLGEEEYQRILAEKFAEYYAENWQGKVYRVEITINGANPTNAKADIKFK